MAKQILFAIALIWSLLSLHLEPSTAVRIRSITVEVAPNKILTGRFYMPPGDVQSMAPVPTVLFCHGLSSHKDTFAPLAWELAVRGIAGVVFDFGGYGRSYDRPISPEANLVDAEAMLNWMKQQPLIDADALGIAGHSMGGTTALEMAQAHPELKSTVLLGIAGFATPSSPANLMFGSGVYEEFNPVGQMQAIANTSAGQDIPPHTTLGNFAEGTARRLVFSPTIDHALAPYDKALQEAAIAWFSQSFERPLSQASSLGVARPKAMVLAVAGAAGLLAELYQWMLEQLLLEWQKRGLRWAIAALLVALSFSSLGSPFSALPSHNSVGAGIALIGLPIFWVGNRQDRDRQESSVQPRSPMLLYVGLIFGLYLLAIVVNAGVTGSLMAVPTALWRLPELSVNLLLGLPYHGFHRLRYALATLPGVGLLFCAVVAEGLWPGRLLKGGDALIGHLLQRIRQPLDWGGQQMSKGSVVLVALLLGVLVAIVGRQLSSGVLAGEAGAFVLRILGVFLALPGVLGMMVLRSRWFQGWESRLMHSNKS